MFENQGFNNDKRLISAFLDDGYPVKVEMGTVFAWCDDT
jgi:hypothetical protein